MTRGARQKLLAFALGLSFACSTAAQEPNASSDTPRFEVASIKPVDPKAPHTMGVHVYPGGRVVISGFPLKTLILAAFDLGWWQLSAGEAWMSSEQYAVTAQPPEALRSQIHSIRYTLFNIDDPMLRRMLQSLLVDRFHLKFHQDSKTGEVYLLERNAKPLALHAAKIPAGASESVPFGSIGFASGKWSLFDTTMPQLARYASSFILHAPVVDRTELTGVFDFRGAQPDLEPQYSGDQSTSFKAFLAQAGLKLERSKGEFQTFVIDEATRPSEN